MVADGERLSLGCVVSAIIARKSFPAARFHFAVPSDADISLDLPDGLLDDLGVKTHVFPFRSLLVEGRDYRILNKVRALSAFGPSPVLFCDSDLFFVRAVPVDYFTGRTVPAATPEHGRHDFPWESLYPHFDMYCPSFRILCGGGEVSLPWFNAGLVYAPNGAELGGVWEDLCVAINQLDWVPERWPYLDQIALPLAMAKLTPGARVMEASVLDGRLNQNLFHWMHDQSYAEHGFGVHHHGRVSLIRRYFPRILMWLREDYPILDELLDRYSVYDDAIELPVG